MNQRKIQRTGIATYTISLPKIWVKRNHVNVGDVVYIQEEDDQSLRVLLNQSKEQTKSASLNLSGFKNPTELIRKFTSLYLNGYSQVHFFSLEPISKDFRKTILTQIKKVIGFEIVEESEKKIVLQDFFSSNYLSISNTIRRSFQLSKLMINESLKILDKETNTLENIEIWEEEVNKLYLLARRQINFALENSMIMSQLSINVKDCQDYIILSGAIEKMADSFVRIAKAGLGVSTLSDKLLQQIRKTYELILEAYELAFESIFKNNFILSNQALAKCEEILNEGINLEQQELNEEDKVSLYIIKSKLQTKTNFINEIAEIGLDRS
ncbi:phosphate uptake regulator PhoU [Candidatus Woesearchaeota archaeon]|nr:phosphate uptake regulator PhoU [Candidatus Woesearchaeota archaeon]